MLDHEVDQEFTCQTREVRLPGSQQFPQEWPVPNLVPQEVKAQLLGLPRGDVRAPDNCCTGLRQLDRGKLVPVLTAEPEEAFDGLGDHFGV